MSPLFFPHLTDRGSRDSERWKDLLQGQSKICFSWSQVLLQNVAAPAAKVLCLQSYVSGGGGRVSAPPFYILLRVSDSCRIHMPQSCGGLLFAEMLNALQVFLTKVIVWCVEAALRVCTSVCLQLQLSLSKQVLYQMVICNYFTLSLLNCPVLRPGNKTSIIFVLFLSGSMWGQNVEYGVSGT